MARSRTILRPNFNVGVGLYNSYGGNDLLSDPTGFGRQIDWASEDHEYAVGDLEGVLNAEVIRGYSATMWFLPSGHPTFSPAPAPQTYIGLAQVAALAPERKALVFPMLRDWYRAHPNNKLILYTGWALGDTPGSIVCSDGNFPGFFPQWPTDLQRVLDELEPFLDLRTYLSPDQLGIVFDYTAPALTIDHYLDIRRELIDRYGIWVSGEALPYYDAEFASNRYNTYLDYRQRSPFIALDTYVDNNLPLQTFEPEEQVGIGITRKKLSSNPDVFESDAQVITRIGNYRSRGAYCINFASAAFDSAILD